MIFSHLFSKSPLSRFKSDQDHEGLNIFGLLTYMLALQDFVKPLPIKKDVKEHQLPISQ